MFIFSNIVGSSIQITTLPLPVLSTLQAVWPSQGFLLENDLLRVVGPADPRGRKYVSRDWSSTPSAPP